MAQHSMGPVARTLLDLLTVHLAPPFTTLTTRPLIAQCHIFEEAQGEKPILVAQPMAALRYAGKRTRLYPEDEQLALKVEKGIF